MSDHDDFTPRLGRIKSLGSKRAQNYLNQVKQAVARAGGNARRGSAEFSGTRLGRGAGIGCVLASRDKYTAFRQRRVVVKARYTRLKGRGMEAARAHLRYIQRDGVQCDGSPGELYSRDAERIEGKAFQGRCEGDRHQFRFIVAAEDGDHYDDLKPFVRRLMDQMERDLGTNLDWVAVDHHNTGHPHTHIVLRGKTERGEDLVIAPDYIRQGIRARASDIVTFDLGLRTDQEIENRLNREVDQERFTSIDRQLLKDRGPDHAVRPMATVHAPFDRALKTGRLQKLVKLGFAAEAAPGVWTLVEDLEPRLRALGLRGDIIKTMHWELSQKHVMRAHADCAIYDPMDPNVRPIAGRVVAKGLADDLSDRQFVILDGTDGYTHYVDLGTSADNDHITEGIVLAVRPKEVALRPMDRTIAEIAAVHGGRYDLSIHLHHDPSATAAFAETHIRRLEAIRKLTGGVERTPQGVWIIAPDHLDRVTDYETRRARLAPVSAQVLSRVGLEAQISANGATWLDRELTRYRPTPLRDAGFGREAAQALERRRLWLMEQNLATAEGGRVVLRANLLAVLRRRELARVSAQLAQELGMSYVPPGKQIAGIYRKPVDLVSGRFAVIESAGKEFTLVPWRSALDRALGREVSGMARGDNISWTITRSRGLSR